MSLTERERHDAYEAITRTFGDQTDNVIRMLQPVHELATKSDLAVTTAELRAEMGDVRAEMGDVRAEMGDVRAEMGDVRAEMADLRTDLRTEMADLRTDLKTEMADLRVEFRTALSEEIGSQTRAFVIALVGSVVLLAIANLLTIALV